jgi:molybdopterin synthase sulfur carrier subunit
MLKIHYFASVRERLGCSEESLDAPENIKTVADLTAVLAGRGGSWALLEEDGEVLVAVDQAVADRAHELTGHEEIAFFPPMTGG